jgi:hypothetical protein
MQGEQEEISGVYEQERSEGLPLPVYRSFTIG